MSKIQLLPTPFLKFNMTADTFFKELQRLILAQPKRPAQILNSEDCVGNYIYYCKNITFDQIAIYKCGLLLYRS